MEEMKKVDKEILMDKMSGCLKEILSDTGLDAGRLGEMTGIPKKRILEIMKGETKFQWNEYLSVVFVLWSNDKGKRLLEERGLFPTELQMVFSVDRKAHTPNVV